VSRLALLMLVGAAGCWEMMPASKEPIPDAAHREPRVCPATGPVYPVDLFSPTSVVSVAPLYYTRSEHGNQEQHLFGSTLTLRPFSGVSTQELERLLSCHGARSLLQREGEPVVANDPYWLPGHVVRITVEVDDGATTVHVEARDFEGAKLLLDRARAFVQPTAG
jgi:hypothetical protein